MSSLKNGRGLWLGLLMAATSWVAPRVPTQWLLPTMMLEPSELNPQTIRDEDLPPVVPSNLPQHLRARTLDETRRFPLVVSPANATISLDELAQWIKDNRQTVQSWLNDYGAVLLRGFEADGSDDHRVAGFESVAAAFSDRLDDVYLGTSPRSPVSPKSRFVFTASEFEPWKVVPQHCEMSFLPAPPEHLFFFAANISDDMWGGESPLVDMRAVAREMAPEVAETFSTRGIRYIRHYPDRKSTHPADTLDFFKTKYYQDMFRHLPETSVAAQANASAEDAAALAAAIEKESRQQGFTPSWGTSGVLKLTHETPAFRAHPTTGDRIWFNHFGVLHSASWADEFAHAALHLDSAKYALLAHVFYALDWLMHTFIGSEALGQHVTHHGGVPFAPQHQWHARRLMWRHTLTKPWQQGDLIILDNYRIAHARMPHADVPRKLWAVWTKPPTSVES